MGGLRAQDSLLRARVGAPSASGCRTECGRVVGTQDRVGGVQGGLPGPTTCLYTTPYTTVTARHRAVRATLPAGRRKQEYSGLPYPGRRKQEYSGQSCHPGKEEHSGQSCHPEKGGALWAELSPRKRRNPGYSTTTPGPASGPAFAIFRLSPESEGGQIPGYSHFRGIRRARTVTF